MADPQPLDVTRVAPKLWIGGRAKTGPVLRRTGFDFLVLCAQEWQPPERDFDGLSVHHAPFDDSYEGLTPHEERIAHRAAAQTVHRLRAGQRCLVTCQQGRNRSGLVTALALSGVSNMTPAQAGKHIQGIRANALTNPRFCEHLESVRVNRGPGHCDLCAAEPVTPRYYEDRDLWIADCRQCRVPMAVYKRHGVRPPRPVSTRMRALLIQLSGRLRPTQAVRLTDDLNSIPSHYHIHARPVG